MTWPQIPWNKGRKETRTDVLERQSASHQGKSLTSEQRLAISHAMIGRQVSKETRDKIRAKMLGRIITWGDKISAAVTGRKHTRATKKAIATASSIHWSDPVFKTKVSASIRAAKSSEKGYAKSSAASRKIWANPLTKEKRAKTIARPSVKKKMIRGALRGIQSAKRKPNGLEKQVGKFLESVAPGKWRYNGGGKGSKMIAGHFPDFVCDKQNKIIEVDGEYWHTDKAKDRKRNRAYRMNGYRLLVVKSGSIYNGTANKRMEKFSNGHRMD